MASKMTEAVRWFSSLDEYPDKRWLLEGGKSGRNEQSHNDRDAAIALCQLEDA